MRKKLLAVLCLCFVGCGEKVHVEFVQVCQEHASLTSETGRALVLSIDDELAVTTDNDARQALLDLKERILFMEKQASAIDKYVKSSFLDRELLIELLKKSKATNRRG